MKFNNFLDNFFILCLRTYPDFRAKHLYNLFIYILFASEIIFDFQSHKKNNIPIDTRVNFQQK